MSETTNLKLCHPERSVFRVPIDDAIVGGVSGSGSPATGPRRWGEESKDLHFRKLEQARERFARTARRVLVADVAFLKVSAGQHRREEIRTTGDPLIALVPGKRVWIRVVLSHIHAFSLRCKLVVPVVDLVEVKRQEPKSVFVRFVRRIDCCDSQLIGRFVAQGYQAAGMAGEAALKFV